VLESGVFGRWKRRRDNERLVDIFRGGFQGGFQDRGYRRRVRRTLVRQGPGS
jgi:hypothetical protein